MIYINLLRTVINWTFTIYFFLFILSVIEIITSFIYQKIKRKRFPTENDKALLIWSICLIFFPAMMMKGIMISLPIVSGIGQTMGNIWHILAILFTIIFSGVLIFFLGKNLQLSKRAKIIFSTGSLISWFLVVCMGIAISICFVSNYPFNY